MSMEWKSLPVALFLSLSPVIADAGPVNINTADAKTLSKELVGVGEARAKAIVEYRKHNGPFKSTAELAKVKGVGQSVLRDNQQNLLLSDPDGTPRHRENDK